MHVGRVRAGWAGLVAAGLAFIVPSALLVGLLAAVYVRTGHLPAVAGLLLAVQPVVVVIVLQAVLPLARLTLRSWERAVLAISAAAAAWAGAPELYVLLAAGIVAAGVRAFAAVVAVAMLTVVLSAAGPGGAPPAADVFQYFLTVGSLLFGSGYVLLPVLEGDLVGRLQWLTRQELLDAVAAGQATPGPVFTTATFVGYLLGGAGTAVVATVGMFLPAFVYSAIGSMAVERLRLSATARAFLDGVNAAAVALIAVVLAKLAQGAWSTPAGAGIAASAALAMFVVRVPPTVVLLSAAAGGLLYGAL